jgi:acetylornithine/N-succinyldiaminopimelate aminotransferase
MSIKESDKTYLAATYKRFDVCITGGNGSVVYDENGKEYIDLGGGIAVNTFGIADKEWINTVTHQLNQVQHTSNLYYSVPNVMLAEMLCNRTGMKKVFFSNSGAEANECAIKAARKYSADKYGDNRYTIITLKNSFHGRTVTTLAATGQDKFHTDFQPLTPGFAYVEPGDLEAVKEICKSGSVAAIMIEVVQGEGGVLPLEYDFVKKLYEFTSQNDILLICDEVQCGNGRTGKLFGYMNYDITPDIVTTAKGLGGGLPLGATLLGERVKDTFTPGSHGSTFGGNPVCCAGAINILSRLNEKVLDGVKRKSEFIINTLKNAKGIKGITGMGLMLGIETEGDAGEIINECISKGILPIAAKNKVRLLPALNIPDDLLKKAVNVIKNVCEVYANES